MRVNCIVCGEEMYIAPENYAGICWRCTLKGWTFEAVEKYYPNRHQEMIKEIKKRKEVKPCQSPRKKGSLST